MPKTIKIDFFKVAMPEDAEEAFEALLNRIADMPIAEDVRTQRLSSDPVRLQELHHRGGYLEGDMVRTRMDNLPAKSNIDTGELAPLDLEEDEGLGEEAAFLYDPQTACLVMQRNRFSVSATAFATYCSDIGEYQTAIILEPIISGDVIARLHEFDRVRRLRIKVAGLAGGEVLRNTPYSLAHIAAFANDYASPTVNIEVSMGHQGGSLMRQRVNEVVEWLRQRAGGSELEVQQIKVAGSAPGEGTEVLDLLESRIIEERRVDVNEQRIVPYSNRREAVRAAWGEQRQRIQLILRRPQ